MTETPENTLTEAEILAFLKDNPNFLNDHPELVVGKPKHSKRNDGVIDFQGHMIQRLKNDRDETMRTTQDIVEIARSNMSNQARIQRAVLHIMEANDFDDFIHMITMDLAPLLNVDIISLLIEMQDNQIPHVGDSDLKILPTGTIDKWMTDKAILLEDNITGLEQIYGGAANLVQSQALVVLKISDKVPPALICLGSRDPELFHPSQATDQLKFFCEVLERQFRLWLMLPH